MPRISALPTKITDSEDLQATDNVVLQRTGGNPVVPLSILSTYFGAGGGSTEITNSIEFILHTATGAITPTKDIVVIIVMANITLPAITNTPRIIGMVFFSNYTITAADGDMIHKVSTGTGVISMATKEAIILASSDTTNKVWFPLSYSADVSIL
jgi:hypothetical protein